MGRLLPPMGISASFSVLDKLRICNLNGYIMILIMKFHNNHHRTANYTCYYY